MRHKFLGSASSTVSWRRIGKTKVPLPLGLVVVPEKFLWAQSRPVIWFVQVIIPLPGYSIPPKFSRGASKDFLAREMLMQRGWKHSTPVYEAYDGTEKTTEDRQGGLFANHTNSNSAHLVGDLARPGGQGCKAGTAGEPPKLAAGLDGEISAPEILSATSDWGRSEDDRLHVDATDVAAGDGRNFASTALPRVLPRTKQPICLNDRFQLEP